MKKNAVPKKVAKQLDPTLFQMQSLLETVNETTGFAELDDLSKRILFFVGAMTASNQRCRVTDVASGSKFGTAPTVYTRLSSLNEDGWVNYETDPVDGRAKILTPTARATTVFNKMSQQLRRFMKSS
jgi:hypothetical protein